MGVQSTIVELQRPQNPFALTFDDVFQLVYTTNRLYGNPGDWAAHLTSTIIAQTLEGLIPPDAPKTTGNTLLRYRDVVDELSINWLYFLVVTQTWTSYRTDTQALWSLWYQNLLWSRVRLLGLTLPQKPDKRELVYGLDGSVHRKRINI